jgi:hypothetical protein
MGLFQLAVVSRPDMRSNISLTVPLSQASCSIVISKQHPTSIELTEHRTPHAGNPCSSMDVVCASIPSLHASDAWPDSLGATNPNIELSARDQAREV